MYKICHSGCPVTKTQTHDAVYVGKMELKLEGGSKTKKLYFQVN